MPINGEKFLRGETIEHRSGALYVYEGKIPRSHMWGVTTTGNDDFYHVLATLAGDLYLEPGKVFDKNYAKPGGFSPKVDQIWVQEKEGEEPYRVMVHAVVDGLVVYDRAGKDYVSDSYIARTVDNFTSKFRRLSDGN